MDAFEPDRINQLLHALDGRLALTRTRVELVVIGGAGLTILGLVERPTRDVDVVALLDGGELRSAKPLPEALVVARAAVAADFGVSDGWLNPGPGDLLEWRLPEGFVGRLTRRDIGSALVLHLASRLDQIHFKLYAFVDQGLGRHEEDLRALEPTAAELEAAARWTISQDPSEGYRQELLGALRYLGVDDVALDG